MKIEETTKIDDNGSYSKITTTTQTPEDGLLTKSNHTTTSSNKIRTSSQSFYGYEKHIHYETSDPKIMRFWRCRQSVSVRRCIICEQSAHVTCEKRPETGAALRVFVL